MRFADAPITESVGDLSLVFWPGHTCSVTLMYRILVSYQAQYSRRLIIQKVVVQREESSIVIPQYPQGLIPAHPPPPIAECTDAQVPVSAGKVSAYVTLPY